MRLLADESCDFRVVRALRTAGHDVAAVIEFAPGSGDIDVIDTAVREQRIFITEDRDFGQLVYATTKTTHGVILLRYPSTRRANLPAIVAELIARYGEQLGGRFIVVEPGRIRIGAPKQ
jgi:predicted nuclease of predicted toxin-antitoxin system